MTRLSAFGAIAAVLAGPLLLAAPAAAEPPTPILPPGTQAETMARSALEQLLLALGLALKAIPQFGAPEFNDRGDIVIPRMNTPDTKRPRPEPGPDDAWT